MQTWPRNWGCAGEPPPIHHRGDPSRDHAQEEPHDAQKALEALRCSWEVVGVIAARAGLRRGACVAALVELAQAGEAQWTVKDGVRMWRMAK